MDLVQRINKRRERRENRVRRHIRLHAKRPRISVFRSAKHIYAQIIDDVTGQTLVSASTRMSGIDLGGAYPGSKEAAVKVGQMLAAKAKEAGVEVVCFDRGSYRYHGRVAALADAAREGGLQF